MKPERLAQLRKYPDDLDHDGGEWTRILDLAEECLRLRVIVEDVVDGATIHQTHGEETSHLHWECSDCGAESAQILGMTHDPACIVPLAKVALAPVSR